MQKTRLLDRIFAVHAAAIGQAHHKEFKQFYNKELSRELERQGCALCSRNPDMCVWDLEAHEPTCKPDETTTDHVVKFCSVSCMVDIRCVSMCSNCGCDSKGDHIKKPGEGWLNPHFMRKLGEHTQSMLHI